MTFDPGFFHLYLSVPLLSVQRVLSSFPSLHSFCPFQTSPEELPCLGILPLPQNRTTIAMKPKQVSESQRRNVVSVGKEEGLLYPMILFWEYCCNSRLCC